MNMHCNDPNAQRPKRSYGQRQRQRREKPPPRETAVNGGGQRPPVPRLFRERLHFEAKAGTRGERRSRKSFFFVLALFSVFFLFRIFPGKETAQRSRDVGDRFRRGFRGVVAEHGGVGNRIDGGAGDVVRRARGGFRRGGGRSA